MLIKVNNNYTMKNDNSLILFVNFSARSIASKGKSDVKESTDSSTTLEDDDKGTSKNILYILKKKYFKDIFPKRNIFKMFFTKHFLYLLIETKICMKNVSLLSMNHYYILSALKIFHLLNIAYNFYTQFS